MVTNYFNGSQTASSIEVYTFPESETMPTLATYLIAIVAFSLTGSAEPQSTPAAPSPTFDVASVKQNKTYETQRSNVPLDTGNVYSTLDPSDKRTPASGYFVAINQPLWRYLTFAYKLSGTQELALRFSFFEGLKSTAPTWVTGTFNSSAERFNIEARAPENSSLDDLRLMMRALLVERFHLAAHIEARDAPAFGLVLLHPGVTGPALQLHPASDPCSGPPSHPEKSLSSSMHSEIGALPPVCGVIAHVPSSEGTQSSFGGRAVPLALLATSLPTMTGMATIPRPVVNQTGLAGLYDFTLQWKSSADPETGDNAAFFRDALKAQLGIELKATHATINILVIDHVERPSEN